ncbi:MAG: ribosome maturation factor RimM [Alphaproteobacteria bacterium]
MPRERICIGVIVGAHGVQGAVRVRSFTDDPGDVGAYGPVSDESGERTFELEVTGRAKGAVIARIAGVSDRDAAQALAGLELHVPRAALPEPEEDEFYYADLAGLVAELADGTRLGKVAAVYNFGAGDVVEVERDEGGSLMVPFTRAVVPVVDLDAGRMVIDPPAGLIGGAAEEPAAEEAGTQGGGTRRSGGG